MKKSDRRLIYFLLITIIISSIVLIIKIKISEKKQSELYKEIYDEYNQMINAQNEVSDEEEKDKTYIYTNAQGINMRVIGEISIPKINVAYPIIFETTDEYLKIAPCKLCGPKINTVGNICIIGHNYRNYKFFSNIDKLEKNDKVFLKDVEGKTLIYYVYDKYVVLETDLDCLDQETDGEIELTLITCIKSKKERLVVKCKNVQ